MVLPHPPLQIQDYHSFEYGPQVSRAEPLERIPAITTGNQQRGKEDLSMGI